MLDAVEHRRETFTITRNGDEIARVEPVRRPNGRQVKDILRKYPADPELWEEIKKTRELLVDKRHTWDD